jgi:hypothetical protein
MYIKNNLRLIVKNYQLEVQKKVGRKKKLIKYVVYPPFFS